MVTRRTLLRASGALALSVLTACRRARPTAVPESSGPDRDERLRARAAVSELALLASYDAALGRHPRLRPALVPLRAHHAAHLAALGGGRAAPSPPTGSGVVPPHPRTALARLVAAERTAAAGRARDCLDAGAELAPLLGSVAASEASHAALLEALP